MVFKNYTQQIIILNGLIYKQIFSIKGIFWFIDWCTQFSKYAIRKTVLQLFKGYLTSILMTEILQ